MSSPKNSVLYVSYPMLPVSDSSCGGAEQMLWALESEMSARGWRTVVAGCEGSRVSGELFATGNAPREDDRLESREAEHSAKVIELLRRSNGDFGLVHDKSGSFWKHAGATHLPLLVTLHLPRTFYDESLFREIPPNVYFNCVSESQAKSFADLPRNLAVVQNGIAVERFPMQRVKGDYLLWLGRICPEKGAHVAIEVARAAGLPLVLAGQVYRFSYHQQYFEREIKPRIGESGVTFVESPSFEEKVSLLANARALVIPTLAPETSSLVAMEAMACGTPVVALRRGALEEVVENGVTGFVVDTPEEMAAAIQQVEAISAEACRRLVEEKFSAERMGREYEEIYKTICNRVREAFVIG